MKTLKKIFLISIATLLVLSSCTVEKRVYRPGYNVETFISKPTKTKKIATENQTFAKKEKVKKPENTNVKKQLPAKKEKIVVAENTNTANDYNITASADNEPVIIPPKKKIKIDLNKQPVTKQNKSNKIIKHKQPKNIKEDPEDEPKLSGFALAGFICALVGLFLVLITGWPFLLGTLGVVFSGIGLGQTSKGKKGKGFAIAGLIIGIIDILLFWMVVAYIAGAGGY